MDVDSIFSSEGNACDTSSDDIFSSKHDKIYCMFIIDYICIAASSETDTTITYSSSLSDENHFKVINDLGLPLHGQYVNKGREINFCNCHLPVEHNK